MEWFTQIISATAVAVGVHTVANRAVSATIIMAASPMKVTVDDW